MKFQGVMTALVTPFRAGQIDYDSLKKLIDHQLENGIGGFVVCGTTAESPTLTEQEKLEVLKFVCDQVQGRVPLLFGSGSNCTQSTIELSQKACRFPIDGLLVVVPYYNKPPQEGLLQHFEHVAQSVEKPVVLYNVPGRTVAGLEPQTLVKLAAHPNIVGLKDATGDLEMHKHLVAQLPKDFVLLSGDDGTSIEYCYLGGHGVISVCSHVAPGLMVDWVKRARNQDGQILEEFEPHKKWISQLYTAPNPIPVKAALVKKGLIAHKGLRLPLVAFNENLEAKMLETFAEFEGVL